MEAKEIFKKIIPQWIWMRLKSCEEKYYDEKMQKKRRQVIGFQSKKKPYGVNLIGDIRSETGLGQSMRTIADLLAIGNIPFVIKQMDVPDIKRQETKWDSKIATESIYSINIIHINNSVWRKNYNRIPIKDLNGRYIIAYWLWELEEFPEQWVSCIDTVDEIWTPSEFISAGIRKKTNKPVMTMPYGMELDMKNQFGREYFDLPEDKFLFLAMYDFLSISERKNPKGIIKAYKLAFEKENKHVGLIIKINHLKSMEELESLKKELSHYPNIYFITDNLTRDEVESLIAVSDVLVSLHRAEGFGLPLAEAMYLGTPVVATNWSATTEFMDERSACLVDYKLITLMKDIGPYHKGNRWADADVIQAAEYMKRLSVDEVYYNDKVDQGKKHIKECLGMEKMAYKIQGRIKQIYETV